MKRLYTFLLIVFSSSALLGQSLLYLKQPYDGSVFSSETSAIHFSWNHDGSANYTLEIADEPTFATPNSFNTTENQFDLTQASLFPNDNYWRIISDFGTSTVRHFEVLNLSDFGPIVYHIDANSNVTLDASKVSQWGNKASGSYNASQNTSSLRPEFISEEINRQPVVKFGGSSGFSQHRLSLSPLIVENLDFTVFTVYKQQSVNTGLPYILGFSNGTREGGIHARGSAGTFNNFGIVYTNPLIERRPNFQGDFKWATRSILNNSIFINNSEVSGYTGSGIDGFRINMIGSRPDNTSLNFHGDLAEVIVYESQLTTADRLLVEEYLITKYRPYPDLGNDIEICSSEVTLGPINDPAFISITWSTGETNVPTIDVNQNGWYWVEAEAFGRTVRDSIFVDGLVTKPILSQANDTTICLYDTLTVSYTNTLPPGISATWFNGSTSASLEIFETDTVYVLFSNTDGCNISSDTIIINVNQFPANEGLGVDRSVCLNTNLYFEYGNASGGPYTHLWGDGSTEPSFEPTTLGTQEYTIEVTGGMGCTVFDTVQIELLNVEGPIVFFDTPKTCPYSAHLLVDGSTPYTGDPIDTYTWYLPDDTLTGANQAHLSNDTLAYTVVLEVTSQAGCLNTYKDTARFFPQPLIYFVNSGNCQSNSIGFLANQFSSIPINTWEWNFDDPLSGVNNMASGLNPSHDFQDFGVYDVQLIGTDQNNCSDTVMQTVNIYPSPSIDFSFTEVCNGDPVYFSNNSSIDTFNGNAISSYSWGFGDGTFSGQDDPQKIYNASGSYNVTLTATSNEGCSNSLTQTVKIHSYPIVDQIVESTCAGLQFTLTDNSFVNGGSVGNVDWDLGGSLNLNGFIANGTIDEPGSYNVMQSVSSSFGCTSIDTFSIDLEQYINASFSYSPNALIAGAPTQFTSTSIGADFYEWNIESIGSFLLPDTTIVFPDSLIGDTLDVQLAVENSFGCRDSVVLSLPVLERSTDLLVDELFLQEENGFYTVGVRLTNKGTTPISEVDLFYNSPSNPALKETWEGLLQASETTIYVFESSPSSGVPLADTAKNYVCVRGRIIQPNLFAESDLSNNEVCNLIEPSESVVIAPQPNPVNESYTVKVILSSSETGTLKVFDAQGREVDVIFENEMLHEGLNSYEVDASSYANGGYTLRYVGEQQTEQVKIIKQ